MYVHMSRMSAYVQADHATRGMISRSLEDIGQKTTGHFTKGNIYQDIEETTHEKSQIICDRKKY